MNKSCRVLLKLTVSASMLMAAGIAQAQLYWRGDVGYSWSTGANIQDKDFNTSDLVICGDITCTVPGSIDNVGNSALLSLGGGWRFSPNLRADGTVTYRGWYKIDSTVPDGFGSTSNIKADVSSWNIMANGYWDFPLKWGALYVGAGIGWASNKVGNVSITDPILPGITGGVPGGTTSNFAWALMVGVGYNVSPALTLDLAVRYSDLGKLETNSGVVTANGIATGLTYSGAQGDLKAWELTVGLRF